MDDPNKLNHIFGNPDHNLDVLVRRYGSQAAAFLAIDEAVNQAYHAGILVVDALGRYERDFEVGEYPVTVRGWIGDAVARIGTAWLRLSTTGTDDA
jgi:hypothetical protein